MIDLDNIVSEQIVPGLLIYVFINSSNSRMHLKTARVYASFKCKIGTAPQLRDPWIKYKF